MIARKRYWLNYAELQAQMHDEYKGGPWFSGLTRMLRGNLEEETRNGRESYRYFYQKTVAINPLV